MAVGLGILWSVASPVGGQTPPTFKAARTPDGEPDLNGFWQALNTANWDLEEHGALPSPYPNLLGAYLAQPPGFSVVEGGTIPYRPEALARRQLQSEKRLVTDPLLVDNISEDTADPEAKCFGPAPPRGTYLPYPFQIIHTRDTILIAYQYGGQSVREIHMVRDAKDDKELVKARARLLDIDSWMGQSVGRWDGDTLVVDARWFSDTVWLDRAGNYYSMKATVTERYTPISPYHLRYEATIEDPDTFTRPWKISMPLYKRIDPNMELLEFPCILFAEEFMYGTLKKKL
jgi:hypothetical protein